MKAVTRSDIVDYLSWTDLRDALLLAFLDHKAARRLPLRGPLCLLFESHETVRWQIQEMMRVERIVREREIVHEIDTYNELLGGPGEIGATLLIGVQDEGERAELLRRWAGLNGHLFARLADGRLVRPIWDERQVGDERLSAVQYLRFPVGGEVPVAFGCDFDDPRIRGEVEVPERGRAALAEDLREDG